MQLKRICYIPQNQADGLTGSLLMEYIENLSQNIINTERENI